MLEFQVLSGPGSHSVKKAIRGNRPLDSVVLISTPWSLFNRPSIQLGTLKAYVTSQIPGLNVKAHHVYLEVAEAVGYQTYQAISERTWLAESLYAALLYPERMEKIEKVFNKEAAGKSIVPKMDFQTLVSRVGEVSDRFIRETSWGSFDLAGFSVCFCQLTSSLYFIKHIKQVVPNIRIAVGGSTFAANSIQNLFQVFPEIDFVVIGEGEMPFARLIHHLRNPGSHGKVSDIPGVYSAQSESDRPAVFSQIPDLSKLPMPEYDDYFELLNSFNPQKRFFPMIPAEISRGCWWRKQGTSGKSKGCAFCNLNLQWDGYRTKHPAQVMPEIDHLTSKHRTLSVAFMDNLLPVKTSKKIFSMLADLHKDFRLFGEIRATTPVEVLQAMKSGGIHEVQIGIEAMSTSLLRKLNKGTTAIQNMEILKNCEALGIRHNSNLILHFPGSNSQDVGETLRNLEFALAFRPLRCVPFWLGLESPVWQKPRTYGIRSVFNHPNYAALFPPEIFNSLVFMIQAYRGDLRYQRKLWQPVKTKVRAWKKVYAELHKEPGWDPILSFRDGEDFLILRQRRLEGEPFTHRLVGTSREIYLFCQKHRSIKRIVARFPGVGEEKIIPFLKMMVAKKLMFEENGSYLSLAIPVG